MTTTVVASASVSPVTLSMAVARIYRQEDTGSLFVEHDGGVSKAFFRDGLPVGAVVFARFKSLGQHLLEQGTLDIETYDATLSEMAGTRRLHGEILVEKGLLTREQLLSGLRIQHHESLGHLLRVRTGRYRFETGAELPTWTRDVALSPQEAVLALLRDPAEADRVARLLSFAGQGPVTLAPSWQREWPRFEMKKAEFKCLERLEQTPMSVEALIGTSELDPAAFGPLVAALSCFRVLAPA